MDSKKLNPLELAVFSLSVLFLTISLWEIYQDTQPPMRDFFFVAYGVVLITLLYMTFTPRPGIFLTASFIQTVFIFSILINFSSRFDTLEIVLILMVLFNLVLRITTRLSLPLVIIILLIQFSSAFFSGESNLGISGAENWNVRSLSYAFIIELTFILLFQTLIVYREKLVLCQEKLEHSQESLKNMEAANESFISHITDIKEESAEEERNHITRELHDSLGYAMTNIIMMMNATTYLKDETKRQEYCRMTKNLASTTMEETRNTLYRLRGLGNNRGQNSLENLRKLCQDFQMTTGVIITFISGNMPLYLPERLYNILFRFLQVGFINALKHGKAEEIKVQFWISQTDLSLVIWNEIKGNVNFRDIINREEGIGLTGIRERLSEINGNLKKRVTPSGFEIVINIPIKEINFE
jgi:signal transduction histidine kinase